MKAETDPLDPQPAGGPAGTLHAILHLERAVGGIGCGEPRAPLRRLLRAWDQPEPRPGGRHDRRRPGRRFPLIGDGAGVW